MTDSSDIQSIFSSVLKPSETQDDTLVKILQQMNSSNSVGGGTISLDTTEGAIAYAKLP